MDQSKRPFARLHHNCTYMRDQILVLSGMTADRLDDAETEASLMYEHWCAEYKGPELPDPYMGVCQMLIDWPPPWPYADPEPWIRASQDWSASRPGAGHAPLGPVRSSAVNGLTVAQYFLAIAFGHVTASLQMLKPEMTKDGSEVDPKAVDYAACLAVWAARFIAHARSLLAAGNNQLIQEAGETDADDDD